MPSCPCKLATLDENGAVTKGCKDEFGLLKKFDCDEEGTIRMEVTNKSDEVRNDWTYQYKQSKITAKKTAKERDENFWKECKNCSWQEPEISGLLPIEDGGSVYVRVKVGSSNWYPKTK